jgi:hypothetical protein
MIALASNISGTFGIPVTIVKLTALRAPLVVAGLLAARVSAAEPEPIRIAYSAPSECPAEATMIAQLGQHASIERVTTSAVRGFTFTIARGDTGFVGELAVTSARDAPATREVSAASCDEVVTALVLVAALAIEERASAPRPPVLGPAIQHATPLAVETPWRLAIGAGVARYAGITPSARFGVPIYLAASHGHQEVRATFDRTTSDDLATASFRWTAGRLEGCPYVGLAGRLAVGGCAGVQIGALTSKGIGVDRATTDIRPWIAPEVVARTAVQLGRARVEVEGSLAAPLERDRYYIAPMMTVHQVSSLTAAIATSVAIEFR